MAEQDLLLSAERGPSSLGRAWSRGRLTHRHQEDREGSCTLGVTSDSHFSLSACRAIHQRVPPIHRCSYAQHPHAEICARPGSPRAATGSTAHTAATETTKPQPAPMGGSGLIRSRAPDKSAQCLVLSQLPPKCRTWGAGRGEMKPAESKSEVKARKPEGSPRTGEALPSEAGPSGLQSSSLKDEARRGPVGCPLCAPLPPKPPRNMRGAGEGCPS